MVTFRGLAGMDWKGLFIERFGDSIWWTNHHLLLKDDPEMFRYFEKRGISREDLLDNLDDGESRKLSFEKGSRGYSGLVINENSASERISSIIKIYGGKKKENEFFLSKIPVDKFEFNTDYFSKGSKIILDKANYDYIFRNLYPTKLNELDGFFKYFRGNEFVALCTGRKIIPYS